MPRSKIQSIIGQVALILGTTGGVALSNIKGLLKKYRMLVYIILLAISIGVVFYVLYLFYPMGHDWAEFYSKLATHLRRPEDVDGYINPPWAALLVMYGLLPLKISNVINLMVNMAVLLLLVRKVGGGWVGVVMTFTCPFFWDLGRINPIDWIPVLGFLLPTAWGLPLMAVKPQTLGIAALIKWKKAPNKLLVLVPLAVVVALSFVIWGNWLPIGVTELQNKAWNFSFFPISIPLGLYVLYRAWKEDDEILAAAATPLLTPYLAFYSAACLIGLLSGKKYRKIAFALYIFSIWYFVIEYRRLYL